MHLPQSLKTKNYFQFGLCHQLTNIKVLSPMWYMEYTFGTINIDMAIKIIFKKIISHLKIVMSTYKLIKKIKQKQRIQKLK